MPSSAVGVIEIVLGTMFVVAAIVFLLIISVVRNQRKSLKMKEVHLQQLTESERKYRYLFENSVLGMLRFDTAQHRVLETNAALMKMLGASDDREVEQLLFHGKSSSLNTLVERVQSEGQVDGIEFQTTTSDNRSIWISLSAHDNKSEMYCVLVLTDVTLRRHAAQLLKDLARRIVEAEERERARMARDIHDGVTQSLIVANRHLMAIRSGTKLEGTRLRKSWSSTKKIVETAIDDLRRISHNLRPSIVDDLGLIAAIKGLIAELHDRTGIEVNFECSEMTLHLPFQVEITLYRFFQEGFSNVEKHANARKVLSKLSGDSTTIYAEITDDGKGLRGGKSKSLRVQLTGTGLRGMQDRATLLSGSFSVESAPKKGTKVSLTLNTALLKEVSDAGL